MVKANPANWNRKLIILILFLSLACGISTNSATPSPCPIENLMIDLSLFDEGWYQTGQPNEETALIRFGIKKLSVGFISQRYGVSGHDVNEAEQFEETERQYLREIDSRFSRREGWTEWYLPEQFSYVSPVADQFRFGCYKHIASDVETCNMMGQYDVFLTRFYADISPIMTYGDFEHILQVIDDKMIQCLAE